MVSCFSKHGAKSAKSAVLKQQPLFGVRKGSDWFGTVRNGSEEREDPPSSDFGAAGEDEAGAEAEAEWVGGGGLSGGFTRDTVTNECLQGFAEVLPVTLPRTSRDQPRTFWEWSDCIPA